VRSVLLVAIRPQATERGRGSELERLGRLRASRLDRLLQGGFGGFGFAERKMARGRKPMELRVEVAIAARFIHGQDSLNLVEGASVIAAEHQHLRYNRQDLDLARPRPARP